jgi:hypothetical protein
VDSLESFLSFNTFANYGTNLDSEIGMEVILHILTQKKSVGYYRQMGSVLKTRENQPITITRAVQIGIDIVESIQIYNENLVSKDQRQVSINFEDLEFDDSAQNVGQLDCKVLYYPIKDLKIKEVTI